MTNIHFSIIVISPLVYLSIISGILAGKYLFKNVVKSFRPIFSFIKFNILNNISIIAIEKTNAEKCLKYITSAIIITINTIISIYISLPLL